MREPVWYVSVVLVVYMMVLLARGILDRVRSRPGTASHGLHAVLCAVTDPYLNIVRRITPNLKHGSVDWSVIVGVTVVFVVIQILNLAL